MWSCLALLALGPPQAAAAPMAELLSSLAAPVASEDEARAAVTPPADPTRLGEPTPAPPAMAGLLARRGAPGDTTGEPYFFYAGRAYGSESLVHPLRMVVNGAFGITQIDNRSNVLGDIDYDTGWSNVWDNLRDPGWSIRTIGWKAFLTEEILPVSSNSKKARYWPNYTQHLIGGGMSYRLAAEWFRWNGYAHPKLWSVATMTVYHVFNEVVENDGYVGPTSDPVADLLLFDPASILLFEHDGIAGFFAKTLHMAEWPYQPAYDPRTGALENNGQNFVLKWRLPRSKRWSLFNHYGTHSEVGLSYTRDDGTCWSFGAGLKAGDLVELGDGVRTVDLVPAAGLFYDRENSLMFSLLFANTKDYKLRANLYPGLVRWGFFSPGAFVALRRNNAVVAGVTLGGVPHLPVGVAVSSR